MFSEALNIAKELYLLKALGLAVIWFILEALPKAIFPSAVPAALANLALLALLP